MPLQHREAVSKNGTQARQEETGGAPRHSLLYPFNIE